MLLWAQDYPQSRRKVGPSRNAKRLNTSSPHLFSLILPRSSLIDEKSETTQTRNHADKSHLHIVITGNNLYFFAFHRRVHFVLSLPAP
jgi:hypothetical protein